MPILTAEFRFYESAGAAREAYAQGAFNRSLGSTGNNSYSHASTSIESLVEHNRGPMARSHSAGNAPSLLHPNTALPPHLIGSMGLSLPTNPGGSRSNVNSPTPQPDIWTNGSLKPIQKKSQSQLEIPVPPVVITGAGYVFTQADKQLFAHAVLKFCAQDMHKTDVVAVSCSLFIQTN